MSRKNGVGVFSLDRSVEGPLATALVVQPWMVLVRPPFDTLSELGADLPNGSLRVLVAALDHPQDAVTGSVVFNDPLDSGLLAAVQLDRDMDWPVRPVSFSDLEDEEATVADVHRHLGLRASSSRTVAEPDPDEPGAGGPVHRGGTWPPGQPPTWPPGRSWPPAGDPASHRGICSVIPCCWGCPRNPKC